MDERTNPQQLPSLPDRELQRGDALGDWIVMRRLGGGGFAWVYEVEHVSDHRRGAAKVLHARLATSPNLQARFKREIDVLTQLRHPNVVQVYGAGLDPYGRPYLCMELLVGEDLQQLVRRTGGLSVIGLHRVYEAVCDAVALAHEQGIVHRDIKASNVFACSDQNRIVLLDFGIAKLTDAFAPELTASNQTIGTPGCMAPEQIRGGPIDARTDVYALGAMMFYLLTGQLALRDQSDTMTQYLHLHAKRPKASALIPQLPPAVDELIVRAMAIDPRARFESARALLDALRGVVRQSRAADAVSVGEYSALYVTVEDRNEGSELDERLVSDLEAVLPLAERFLAQRGFGLGLDLGAGALFVAPLALPEDAVRTVLGLWDHLSARATRDGRVRVGIALHRGTATLVGDRVQPGPLARLHTWGMPQLLDGVWISSAFASVTRGLLR